MYDPKKPYNKEISSLIKQTWETPYVSVRDGIIHKKFHREEYYHVDGIGTKGVQYWRDPGFFQNAVIDALNMNRNDLALMRATPYAIIDHLFLSNETEKYILQIMRYLVKECKKDNIAVVNGETSVHYSMLGMDLSVGMFGFVKNPKPNRFELGDILIGIKSNGLHSNGFTKIHELFGDEFRSEFIAPTHNYLNTILNLCEKYEVNGMMHITGGAFTKLKSVLRGCDAILNNSHKLEPPEIFYDIYNKNVSDKEMYETFNCGIGFVLGVNANDAADCLSEIKDFRADVIGKVVKGNGKVKIKSNFSDKEIIY